MQIAPPFGYKEIVPFLKTQKVRLPRAGEVPGFAQRSNALPISYTEFQLIAREYPIVFTSGDGGKTFAAVAVVGMTDGGNLLFCRGALACGAYVPGRTRRDPLFIAYVTVGK